MRLWDKMKNSFWHRNSKSRLSRKTSLTSRDTHKEIQNPLGIKTYLEGFNYDAKLSYKKWSQKIKPSRDILSEKI